MINVNYLTRKNRLGIYLLYVTCICLISLFPCAMADGTEPLQVKVQVERGLNVRSGPSTGYPVITKLPSGTFLDILYIEEDWLLACHNYGKTGWVASRHTSFSPDLQDKLPPILETNVTVQARLLNVRGGPGTEYPRLNQVQKGETLTVYKKNGDWLLVRLADNSTGWVRDNYVSSPSIPQNDAGISIESNEDTREVDNGVKEMNNLPAADPPSHGEGAPLLPRVKVTASSLRLREGPGLQHEITAAIPKNTTLLVHDKDGQWLKVGLPDNREGWVAGWHTEALSDGAETKEKKIRLATVNTNVLRVRSGPGLDFSQTGRVFSGNHLLVLNEEKGWNYVQLPDNSYGWVSGDYTSYNTLNLGGEQNITIIIDPGHGGKDQGATGINGLLEKEVVLTVSLQVAEQLRARNFNVVMTRNSDVTVSLKDRVQIAETAEADLFVSIHANAHPNPTVTGTEAFYFSGRASSARSFYLATLLQQEVSRALHLPSLGTKRARFFVIRETTMPGALLELAFLSNAVDEAILNTSEAQQHAANAIVRAVLSYYNILE